MGIQQQAANTGTPLARFLLERLPQLEAVVDSWVSDLRTNPTGVRPPSHERDSLGWALELRIGLDLASTPSRMRDLSYLPSHQFTALLTAAGFKHCRSGSLPSSRTTDPLLLRWERDRHPVAIDDAQRAALSCCLDLATIHVLIHRKRARRSIDERRGFFIAAAQDDPGLGSDPELSAALSHCWEMYLQHGRQRLHESGNKVTIAPAFADGFGVGDVLLGTTLVDIKLACEPTRDDLRIWLRQLLGYVLLDRHDTFQINSIAVYGGWDGTLLTSPLTSILAATTPARTPTLHELRTDFRSRLRTELDGYTAWKEKTAVTDAQSTKQDVTARIYGVPSRASSP